MAERREVCEILRKALDIIYRDFETAVLGERRADISRRARDLDTLVRLLERLRCRY